MTSTIIPPLSHCVGQIGSLGMPGAFAPSAPPSGGGFVGALKSAVGEVSKLQNDATRGVEQLTLGQTDDVTGVMAAVEKGELALKTLLSIRGKLMSAYDEIRNMPI